MAGYETSAERLTAVPDCRNLTAAAVAVDELPARDLETASGFSADIGRRAAAFAAGVVLVVGAVAGLHHLYRAGDSAADLISWVALLLLAMTALGGGIKLAMWGVQPATAAVFDAAKERLGEPAQAVIAALGAIAGAVGMWWTFRGGYSIWWQNVTGEQGWSLLLGVGQMLVAVLAGAALFAGGKFLAGLAKDAWDTAAVGEHRHTLTKTGADTTASHPALVAALIGGGIGLVIMTAWLVPALAPTIVGPGVLPAMAAITVVLVVALGSNLGWWKGLAGLYAWATDASQKAAATAAVIAILMFSAGGLGLGWFTPATVPVARAACPPDCGGGGGLDGPPGGGSQFRPPDMPASQPDYSSGNYGRPPLDQNSGISIYNENPAAGQVPSQTGGQQSMQEPPFRANPDGSWQARNGEWSPPNYQTATPGLTQGPGKPNPDWTGNQGTQTNPGSQGGNQGAQQPAQQPQQPQENPGQQPNQQPQQSDSQRIDDLTRQLQDQQRQSGQDRQRIDDLTKQLQQQNEQKQQQTPRFPSKDDKKDRDQQEQQDRDQQSGNNDLAALLMGAASTRRRKQDEQEQLQQQQGPDTQALAQDGGQLASGLPSDIANTVSDGANLGQSAGSAAQNFGSAAQAGASLASSAQSGAVNPQDAITLVQGVSGGVKDTADAVKSGSQIASTWLENAGQGTKIVSDINPQTQQQMEQLKKFLDVGKQGADGVSKVADLTSQGAGAVNSGASMDLSQVQSVELMSGDATAMGSGFQQAPQFGPPIQDGDEDPLPGSIEYTIDHVNNPPPAKPLPPSMHPTPSEQNFTEVEKYMYGETMKNLKSDEVKKINELMRPPKVWEIWKKNDALMGQLEFARMVQTNGPWDHKPQIQDLVGIHKGDGLFFQQPGTDRQVYYDMWSNLHFGYIGKAAGLDETSLMAVPNIPTPATGGNDVTDDMYVRAGIDMFNQYGPNMTFEQFNQSVGQLIDQLVAAQQSGTQIDQLRLGYK